MRKYDEKRGICMDLSECSLSDNVSWLDRKFNKATRPQLICSVENYNSLDIQRLVDYAVSKGIISGMECDREQKEMDDWYLVVNKPVNCVQAVLNGQEMNQENQFTLYIEGA